MDTPRIHYIANKKNLVAKCGVLTTQPSQLRMIINFHVLFFALRKINMKSCHFHWKTYTYAMWKISHKLRVEQWHGYSLLFYQPNICKTVVYVLLSRWLFNNTFNIIFCFHCIATAAHISTINTGNGMHCGAPTQKKYEQLNMHRHLLLLINIVGIALVTKRYLTDMMIFI